MKTLDFQRIEIQGFKSFTTKQVWDLGALCFGLHFLRGVNEAEPGLGANDVGKTTIWDALSWVLFGRTMRGLRNPDIRPWFGDDPTIVLLALAVDGKTHRIRRTDSPNTLTLDGKTTTQDALEELLSFGFEVFSHTLVLGQGLPLFLDLTAGDKLQILSETLNLERWEDRSAVASDEAKALDRKLMSMMADKLAKESTATQLIDLLERARKQSDEWDQQRKELAKNIDKELATLEKQLAIVQRNRDEADLAYDSAGTELKALEATSKANEKALLSCSEARSKAELVLKDLKRQGAALEGDLDTLGEADTCPTCNQSIKGTDLAHHKREMKAKINELIKQVAAQQKVFDAAVAAREAVGKKIHDAAKHRDTFRNKAETARATLDFTTPEIANINARIASLKASKVEREETINPHRETVSTLRKRAQIIETELEAAETTISLTSRQLERTKRWVQEFKLIRLSLLDEVLQELELATNALLPASGLQDWQVLYDIERETQKGTIKRGINVTVLSPRNKEAVRWEVWGGGVGQRLRIVGSLALSDVLLSYAGVSCHLEVLDEPTRSMSKEGIRDLCEFLAERALALEKTTLYTDHAANDSANFASVTTVVKTAKGSHLEH